MGINTSMQTEGIIEADGQELRGHLVSFISERNGSKTLVFNVKNYNSARWFSQSGKVPFFRYSNDGMTISGRASIEFDQLIYQGVSSRFVVVLP